MPTITYQSRQVHVTDAAAQHIAAMDPEPARTRPLVTDTRDAASRPAPRPFFTRESREAGCAQLRAQNEANRAFWAARRL